ncbi:unnamed protein product, partial [Nesidiocoris tenuis]
MLRPDYVEGVASFLTIIVPYGCRSDTTCGMIQLADQNRPVKLRTRRRARFTRTMWYTSYETCAFYRVCLEYGRRLHHHITVSTTRSGVFWFTEDPRRTFDDRTWTCIHSILVRPTRWVVTWTSLVQCEK